MEKKQDFVIAYCRKDDQILIVHKDRPNFQKGKINLPGGKIDPEDVNPIAAAVRELKEESGLEPWIDEDGQPDAWEVGRIEANGFVIYVIEILVPDGPIKPRLGETEIVEWITWDHLRVDPRLMPNLRVILPLLMAGIEDWVIRDDGSSWGKKEHAISVQVPTYLEVTANID